MKGTGTAQNIVDISLKNQMRKGYKVQKITSLIHAAN